MNRDYLWTSTHLIKSIVEAIDKVEEDWEENRISGSRPAHLNEAVIESTKMWYQTYLNALDRTIKEIENEVIKLEARNDRSISLEGTEDINAKPK
ncbi:MAG: hypothetical protein AABW88_00120 [Nanoarchaeota archaeon]